VSLYPIEVLYDAVVARFALEGPASVSQSFGWREPARAKISESRIVWIPGDPRGVVGVLGPAAKIDSPYRTLATLAELFTVELGAADPAAPENERAPYRAAHHALPGRIQIQAMEWDTRRSERRYGALLRVVVAVDAVIPDAPPSTWDELLSLTSDTDGTRAEGTVELLDVEEPIQTRDETPLLDQAPTISAFDNDPLVVGTLLACAFGAWFSADSVAPISFAYQWLRDGTPIAGATASTYELVELDEGTTITCDVVASNAAGASLPARSNALEVP
jgi:hypothetical protein